MRNRHVSKLAGNIIYSYLFAPDSTNSIKMKELNVKVKPKINASEDPECFVSWGLQ